MHAIKRSSVFGTPRHKLWRRNFTRFLREHELTAHFQKISKMMGKCHGYGSDLIDHWFYFFEKDIEKNGIVYHNNVISTIWPTFEPICADKVYLQQKWEMTELDLRTFSSYDIGMIMAILFMDEVMSPLYLINSAIQCEIDVFLRRTHNYRCEAISDKLKNIISIIDERPRHSQF